MLFQLASIISSSLCLAISKYFLLISNPMNFLPNNLQASPVLLMPMNGSNTVSATQYMDRYIHIEKIPASTCMLLAMTCHNLLTSSCTVHSRKFPTKAIGTYLQMLVYAIL